MDIFEEEESGLSVHVGKITKSALKATAENIVALVDDGEKDAIEVYVQAKALEQTAKAMQDGVKVWAIEEAYKYDKSKGSYAGVSFSLKHLPNKYSYDHNPEWVRLSAEIESLSVRKKLLEQQMVSAIKTGSIKLESGQVIQPAIIEMSGGETIEVSIPK